MKFLVDQAISWQVVQELASAGHEAVHVRDLGLESTGDGTILERARTDQCIVVTQDTDFGTLLATAGCDGPFVLLLRMRDGRPKAQAQALLVSLETIEADLMKGAIVVISDDAIRVRRLPIDSTH